MESNVNRIEYEYVHIDFGQRVHQICPHHDLVPLGQIRCKQLGAIVINQSLSKPHLLFVMPKYWRAIELEEYLIKVIIGISSACSTGVSPEVRHTHWLQSNHRDVTVDSVGKTLSTRNVFWLMHVKHESWEACVVETGVFLINKALYFQTRDITNQHATDTTVTTHNCQYY